jgi:hypothetical protein
LLVCGYPLLEDYSKNHPADYLTKTQVEYLAKRGGYKFSTADSKNSVAVTLRRLATEGKIEAQRIRGAAGNKYRQKQQKRETVQTTPKQPPASPLDQSKKLEEAMEFIDQVFKK